MKKYKAIVNFSEQKEMNELKTILKNKYKNNIGDGLKFYYSKTRPVNEIIMFLENKDNCFICPECVNILCTYNKIDDKELLNLELKEFDFNFMSFNDNGYIVVDYIVLFDILCYDILKILKQYDAKIKDITSIFKDCLSVDNYINEVNKFIIEYQNK